MSSRLFFGGWILRCHHCQRRRRCRCRKRERERVEVRRIKKGLNLPVWLAFIFIPGCIQLEGRLGVVVVVKILGFFLGQRGKEKEKEKEKKRGGG